MLGLRKCDMEQAARSQSMDICFTDKTLSAQKNCGFNFALVKRSWQTANMRQDLPAQPVFMLYQWTQILPGHVYGDFGQKCKISFQIPAVLGDVRRRCQQLGMFSVKVQMLERILLDRCVNRLREGTSEWVWFYSLPHQKSQHSWKIILPAIP